MKLLQNKCNNKKIFKINQMNKNYNLKILKIKMHLLNKQKMLKHNKNNQKIKVKKIMKLKKNLLEYLLCQNQK